jgi:protein SCO1/2
MPGILLEIALLLVCLAGPLTAMVAGRGSAMWPEPGSAVRATPGNIASVEPASAMRPEPGNAAMAGPGSTARSDSQAPVGRADGTIASSRSAAPVDPGGAPAGAGGAGAAAAAGPSSGVRGESIYQLEASLTDQAGRRSGLDVFRGQPVIISMFYGSCPMACPMLISDVQRLEASLDPEARAQVRVLLISFDPARDTTARLAELVRQHGIDGQRWRVATVPEAQVREVASVLGIKYRWLEDGNINHSSILTVLDRKGVVVGRLEGLRQSQQPLIDALRQAIADGGGRR